MNIRTNSNMICVHRYYNDGAD